MACYFITLLAEKITSIVLAHPLLKVRPLVTETLSDKGKLAVRLGRKATGQVEDLIAGLPKRGVGWMRCRVSMGALEILCHKCFFCRRARNLAALPVIFGLRQGFSLASLSRHALLDSVT